MSSPPQPATAAGCLPAGATQMLLVKASPLLACQPVGRVSCSGPMATCAVATAAVVGLRTGGEGVGDLGGDWVAPRAVGWVALPVHPAVAARTNATAAAHRIPRTMWE